VTVDVLVGVFVVVGVQLGVPLGVIVGVLVGVIVAVLIGVLVAVALTPFMCMEASTYRMGLLTVLLPLSVILLLRLAGAGGENCQWITASPGALAQKLI
jgi:hypothetical protein